MTIVEPGPEGSERAETAAGVEPALAALGLRFWPKVWAPPSGIGCWRFVAVGKRAPANQPATPLFNVRGATLSAVRVAYELTGHGSTAGLKLTNTCGNSECVRPGHHTTRPTGSAGSYARGVTDYLVLVVSTRVRLTEWTRRTDGLVAESDDQRRAA